MIIRPIIFTPKPQRWHQLLDAFGATIDGDDHWAIAELGGGRIAVHHADEPSLSFGIEVPDLAQVPSFDWIEETTAEHGQALRVRHVDLPEFLIDVQAGERNPSGAVSVATLVCTPNVENAARALADLGIRRRQTKNNEEWADLAADGLIGVHIGEIGVVHGFETEDIDALANSVRAAGFDVDVIDETFGRTLRIEHPDDLSQDARIWINAADQDPYGYTVHSE